MIEQDKKHYVCAEDIKEAAVTCAFHMGLSGWDSFKVRKMLKEYSMMMDDISAYIKIPWDKQNEWRICSEYLSSNECINAVMDWIIKGVKE